MKKFTLVLSALVLFAGVSFAQQNPDPAKGAKPATKATTTPTKTDTKTTAKKDTKKSGTKATGTTATTK